MYRLNMNQRKTALWVLLSCFLVSACGVNPPEQLNESSQTSSGLGVSNESTLTNNATSSFAVYAASTNVSMGASTQFSASGGVAPYSYINLSGLGYLNPDTGAYTAPATAASITVEAIDQDGHTASATITVGSSTTTTGGSSLNVSASATSIVPGNTVTFTVTGGVAPYSYALYGGYGYLSVAGTSYVTSTVYTSSTLDNGNVTLQVTDSDGNEVESIVTMTIPPTTTIAVNVYQAGSAQGCGNTPCYLNPDFVTATEACNANGYPILVSFSIMSQYQSQPNEPADYYTGNRYVWTGTTWYHYWDGQCNTGGNCSGPGYIIQNITCE